MEKWLNIVENPPPVGKWIRIAGGRWRTEGTGMLVGYGLWAFKDDYSYSHSYYVGSAPYEWMPLPEPPEKK